MFKKFKLQFKINFGFNNFFNFCAIIFDSCSLKPGFDEPITAGILKCQVMHVDVKIQLADTKIKINNLIKILKCCVASFLSKRNNTLATESFMESSIKDSARNL